MVSVLERKLTIKRVATVVSNYQENASTDNLESMAQGCGRNCLGTCCLPVSNLPLYAFNTAEEEQCHDKVDGSCDGKSPEKSYLNNLLLGQWENRMTRGLFRFEPSEDGETRYFPCSQIDPEGSSASIIAINVSPIEYGHVLLIPRVLDCLPQKIVHDGLMLALHFAKEASNPFFRVGYNSLGAFATINHLHFQAYFLSAPFPIEKAPTCKIMSSKDTRVMVSKLLNYPVKGLVFEGGNKLCDLCDAIASSCILLESNNVAFNLLISDCGKRVFLLPQCYAEKQARGEVEQELLDTQVNPAVWEISGHMVLKRRKDYDEASEQYAWKLLSDVSLSDERFQDVEKYVCEAANLQEDGGFISTVETSYGSGTPQASPHLPQDCLVLR
ncbi:Phosphate metabolism transcription protein [Salvia divinorum]|uniref:GDP-D-glucose phosphorylase 1 n=1 Tax=Salvia divinorum TaxID=28513 RepID=A0ABD1FYT5_SALDI